MVQKHESERSSTAPEVVVLPSSTLGNFPDSIYPEGSCHFDHKLYRSNLHILNTALTSAQQGDNQEYGESPNDFWPILRINPGEACRVMDQLSTAPPARQALLHELGHDGNDCSSQTILDPHQINDIVWGEIERRRGRFSIASDAYAILPLIMQAVAEWNPPEKTFTFVTDPRVCGIREKRNENILIQETRRILMECKGRGIRRIFWSCDMGSLKLFPLYTATECNPYARVLAMGVQDLSPALKQEGFTDVTELELQARLSDGGMTVLNRTRQAQCLRSRTRAPNSQLFDKIDFVTPIVAYYSKVDQEGLVRVRRSIARALDSVIFGEEYLRRVGGSLGPKFWQTEGSGNMKAEMKTIVGTIQDFCQENGMEFGLRTPNGVLVAHFSGICGRDCNGSLAQTVRGLAQLSERT